MCKDQDMKLIDEWFTRISNGASHRSAALLIGMPNNTISNWIKTDRAPADGIIKLARAYNVDPIEALVATGFLYEDEYHPDIEKLPTATLLRELLRREGAQ